MEKIIGIKREDKNKWERRTPLVPKDIKELKEKHKIKTIIQPSKIRIFSDDEYKKAGAEISENLSKAKVIFAVKEIPEHLFEKEKSYVFFSHTIKGQSYNMSMLKKMMKQKNNLIDYERIVDKKKQRLIFFGRYAGIAGMVETLCAFGQKIKLMGINTQLEKIKQPFLYNSLKEVKEEIKKIGEEINKNGFPIELNPLIVGFTGYGNVSRGAQEIFDILPFREISPNSLEKMFQNHSFNNHTLYKVIFKEEDLVKPIYGAFELQDYYENPKKYELKFESYIHYLQIIVNCIYWTEKYPRLITKKYLKKVKSKSNFKLKVIGDISCDVNGSIEITHKATMPDNPVYTYFIENDCYEDGINKKGITVMAVDNLPCEFSRESSIEFSSVLKQFVNDLVNTDFDLNFKYLKLPYSIKKALILHKGKLTKEYKYMNEFLKKEKI